VTAATLIIVTASVLSGRTGPSPAGAEVTYSQNVRAVGETKYVKKWTNYGPAVAAGGCGGRAGCFSAFQYWRVSRGTATVRATTFKVSEGIKDFDYYLLDVDVTTSSRTGTGNGGSTAFMIDHGGTRSFDRNDSKSLDAKRNTCSSVAVTMSTPWPFVTASSTVGHATLCNEAADLRREYLGSSAIYRGSRLKDMRHLTMQRWVKVRARAKPTFDLAVVLPSDRCTAGDGDGHCVKYASDSSYRSITLGTSG